MTEKSLENEAAIPAPFNTKETIATYNDSKEMQEEFPTLYNYLLYVSGGDMSLFDNVIEVHNARKNHLQIEIMGIDSFIREKELTNKSEEIQTFMKELANIDPKEDVAIVIHYKPDSLELEELDEDVYHSPSYKTEVIFGKVRKITRGDNISRCIEGIKATFNNHYNDHSDYHYYESHIDKISKETWLEPSRELSNIENIQWLEYEDNYEHEKLLRDIEYKIDDEADMINSLTKKLMVPCKMQYVNQEDVQDIVNTILTEIQDDNRVYSWNDAEDATNNYFNNFN